MTTTLRPHDLIWLTARDALEGITESWVEPPGIPACRWWCGVMLITKAVSPLACAVCAATSGRPDG
jgi:hypothetical protein